MDMIKAEPENDPLALPNDDTKEEPQSVVDDFLKNCTEAIKVEPDLGYHILSDKKFEENEDAISLPLFKFKVEEDSCLGDSVVKAEPLSEVETDDVTFTEGVMHLDCHNNVRSKGNDVPLVIEEKGDGGTQSVGTENTLSKIKNSVELDCRSGDFSSDSSEDHNLELNKSAYSSCMDDEERQSTEEKGKGAWKVSGTEFEENDPLGCKRGTSSSQKCLNKEKRMRGQDYAGIRKDEFGRKKLIVPRQRRIMKSRCMCKHSFVNGKRNCSEVTEEQRKRMFDHFWNEMSWSDRKMFIKSLVDYLPVKRRRNQSESSHRSNTLHYNFVIEGQRKSVCKVMFLNTLCLGEWSVRNWVTGL